MDIDLEDEIDGISLSCEIRNIDYNGNIVFITGHEEFAKKRSVEYQAFGLCCKRKYGRNKKKCRKSNEYFL